jgi:deoxycytidylate deaminase
MSPCTDCARGIIQTGITKVIIGNDTVPDRWYEDFKLSISMMREAGIEVYVLVDKKLKSVQLKSSSKI